jgi:hypothetical protein
MTQQISLVTALYSHSSLVQQYPPPTLDQLIVHIHIIQTGQ